MKMEYVQIHKERLSFLEEFLISNAPSKATLDYYFDTYKLNKKVIFKVKAACMEGWLKAFQTEIKDLKKRLKELKFEIQVRQQKAPFKEEFSKIQKILSQKQKQCRTISVLHCVYWNRVNCAEKKTATKFDYNQAYMFADLFHLLDDRRIKSFLGLNK